MSVSAETALAVSRYPLLDQPQWSKDPLGLRSEMGLVLPASLIPNNRPGVGNVFQPLTLVVPGAVGWPATVQDLGQSELGRRCLRHVTGLCSARLPPATSWGVASPYLKDNEVQLWGG